MHKQNNYKSAVTPLIQQLRQQGYDEALRILNSQQTEYTEVQHGGKTLQVNISAFYDDKKMKSVRVVVEVYDNNLKWWQRLICLGAETPSYSEDFIIAPDGSFIGEIDSSSTT